MTIYVRPDGSVTPDLTGPEQNYIQKGFKRQAAPEPPPPYAEPVAPVAVAALVEPVVLAPEPPAETVTEAIDAKKTEKPKWWLKAEKPKAK